MKIKKRLKADIASVVKDIKDIMHKVFDPVITAIWEPCYVIKKACKIAWTQGRYIVSELNSRTSAVDIPEFVQKEVKI